MLGAYSSFRASRRAPLRLVGLHAILETAQWSFRPRLQDAGPPPTMCSVRGIHCSEIRSWAESYCNSGCQVSIASSHLSLVSDFVGPIGSVHSCFSYPSKRSFGAWFLLEGLTKVLTLRLDSNGSIRY